jgi:ribose 5-phosphate isomerase
VAEEKLCALIVASTPILVEEEMLVSRLGVPVFMVEAHQPACSPVLEELRTGFRTGERDVLQPGLVVSSSTAAPARAAGERKRP